MSHKNAPVPQVWTFSFLTVTQSVGWSIMGCPMSRRFCETWERFDRAAGGRTFITRF
jgi:hypothetical protein